GQRDYTEREADLQESDLPYLERVRRCYLTLAADREDWRVVPGLDADGRLRSIDEVASEILNHALGLPGVVIGTP
ncbi:MAG: hypothetical protein ACOVRM_13380, partial [Planctomycetaceae bacterium]